MPASSSQYQSRFLNFIVEQSQKLTDRAALTLRQLKVATIWGIEAVTYPFYALAQTLGRKLGTSQKSQFAFDSSATTDTPIDRILAEVRDGLEDPKLAVTSPPPEESNRLSQMRSKFLHFWQVGLAVLKTPATHPHPLTKFLPADAIRGIASCLQDRHLVLVSPENRVLDILSTQKQQQLHHRIVAEVSRDRSPEEIPQNSRFDRPQRWTQNTTEPLNIHSTSATLKPDPNSTLPPQISHPQISALDKTFAELESRHIASFQKLKNLTQQVTQASKLKLQNTLSTWRQPTEGITAFPPHESLQDPWLTSKPQATVTPSATLPLKSTQPISFKVFPPQPSVERPKKKSFFEFIETRLRSFNRSSLVHPSPGIPTADGERSKPLELPTPNLEQPTIVEDITTLLRVAIEDLVETKNIPLSSPTRSPKPSFSKPTFPKPKFPDNFLSISLANPFQADSKTQSKSRISPTAFTSENENECSIVAIDSETLSPANNVTSRVAVSTRSNPSSSGDTDWIEAAAISTGYAKSIGERVLEWLDLALFWIEEQILKLWQWVRQS